MPRAAARPPHRPTRDGHGSLLLRPVTAVAALLMAAMAAGAARHAASVATEPARRPPPTTPTSCAYAALASAAPAWLAIMEGAGAGPLLKGDAPLRGQLTIFAPGDAALARAGVLDAEWAPGGAPGAAATGAGGGPPSLPGSVAALLAAAPAVGPVLVAAHAVRGRLSRADLAGMDGVLTTLATRKAPGKADERVGLVVRGGRGSPTPTLTSAGGVTGALLGAGGGDCGDITVHAVDAVLLPFAPFRSGGG